MQVLRARAHRLRHHAPAVSIAIPTFERCADLERAVRSALDQTHRDLEVVVSDNASQDGTVALLTRLGAADPRLRVARQPSNRGMVANLNAAVALAGGEHVMLLADDDWLAPRAVEATLEAFRERPGAVAALGRVTYVRGGDSRRRGRAARAHRRRPAAAGARLPRRRRRGPRQHVPVCARPAQGRPVAAALVQRARLRVAELAFLGEIALVDEPLIFRELGGTSASTARNVRESRLPRVQARVPHLVIAQQILADIGWRSPVYASLGRWRRLALAARCALGVPRRNLRHALFHLAPAALQRRWHLRT